MSFLRNIARTNPVVVLGYLLLKKMEFFQRNYLCYCDDCIECVSIEIDGLVFSTKRNVVVSVIYRPPNTDTRHFNEKLCALLECISSEKKLCYLIGDYNINILNYGNHSATDEFVDMLYSHAFLPLINCPTRITPTSATIIDNIFTNNIDERECRQNGILVTDISDHFPIFHIGHNTQVIESDETYIISRNYSNVNKLSFQQVLSEIDFFVNIGNNLAKRIPIVKTLPCRYMGDVVQQSLFLDPVTPEEITKIIKSLKNGALGSDEINTKIIQLPLSPIMMPLSFLCNRSLIEGVFPSELKLAHVLPLFKSGDVMLFNNYRPVSLLCTLYQRCLKRSCIPDYLISWTIIKS